MRSKRYFKTSAVVRFETLAHWPMTVLWTAAMTTKLSCSTSGQVSFASGYLCLMAAIVRYSHCWRIGATGSFCLLVLLAVGSLSAV